MKVALLPSLAALASVFVLSGGAAAVTFDQVEQEQDQFIAIAMPLAQGDRYNLLVLEQKSDERPCWAESSETPGIIDPLLLQFDFSQICGRSTDSNGYSIRVGGRDLGLDYRLSVVRRQGQILLMGVPARNPRDPSLTIAQAVTSAPGFLKLSLLPGWRFAKRAYQGKTLGHIYFTRDDLPSHTARLQPVAPPPVTPRPAPSSPVTPRPAPPRARSLPTPRTLPVKPPVKVPTAIRAIPARVPRTPKSESPPPAPQATTPGAVPLPPPPAAKPAAPAPKSVATTTQPAGARPITAPISIPVPNAPTSAQPTNITQQPAPTPTTPTSPPRTTPHLPTPPPLHKDLPVLTPGLLPTGPLTGGSAS